MDPNTNLELRRCPSFMELIQSDCNKDIVCELDSILLQAKIIGEKTRDEYYSYLEHQQLASIRCKFFYNNFSNFFFKIDYRKKKFFFKSRSL